MLKILIASIGLFLATSSFAEDFTFSGDIYSIGLRYNNQLIVESAQGNYNIVFSYDLENTMALCEKYFFQKITTGQGSVVLKEVYLNGQGQINLQYYSTCSYKN